jgi:hypothetical protein
MIQAQILCTGHRPSACTYTVVFPTQRPAQFDTVDHIHNELRRNRHMVNMQKFDNDGIRPI